MWTDLRRAAHDGLLLGVKYGVALLIVGFLILWALGDYSQVRQQAAVSYQTIQQWTQAAQQQVAAERQARPALVPAPDAKK